MSALTTFAFNESLSIRIQNFDGSPWFVAKDIASCLEYTSSVLSNVSALFKNVPDKWKQIKPFETAGGIQNLLAVTEQGLYRFLMRSDKPKAIPFQDWLSEDVLPAIRKQGAYVSDKLTYEEALKIVESRNATLTPAQQYAIKSAVAARAQKEPAKYKEIYSALKRRFQVARYDQIMKEDYEEALTFIREMQLTAQLPARPEQNRAEPVVVNDQEVRYELGMSREEIESFGQFIYCWKYLFRPSLVTFRKLLSAVHSPLAGNLYDATFDTTLNRLEEVFRKHGIPVGPEHLSRTLPFYP